MNAVPYKRCPAVDDTIRRGTGQGAPRQIECTSIDETLERVVDGTDSRIRLVSGYKKKLQDAISSSLDYTEDLVERLPQAIEVSSSTFISNPYVNAFFVNVSDLQTVFSSSSEVREFMEDLSNVNVPECYALLCMHKAEKTVLGTELVGDMLKRDVRQTAVNFSDHRIYSPTPSEKETRVGYKECLFGWLVNDALEHIVQMRLASERFKRERQALQAQLRGYRQKKRAPQEKPARPDAEVIKEIKERQKLQDKLRRYWPDNGAPQHARRPDAEVVTKELEEIQRYILHTKLSMIEEQLKKTHPVTPQDALELVKTVFSHPDEFIQFEKCLLRLNKMGIKLEADSREPGNEIRLTQVKVGDELPRVVTLARFPRVELLPRKEFLAQDRLSLS